MFYSQDKLAILIDGTSFWGASRANGINVDFASLKQEFARRGRLIHAYYYTAIEEDDEYSPIRRLVDWLGYNGFIIRSKPLRKSTDTDGNIRYKRSVNVDIAVDAAEMADHVDHIVLFTGERDMLPLVEMLRRKGVRVSICSTRKGDTALVSDDLRRAADNFIEINDLRHIIDRDDEAQAA